MLGRASGEIKKEEKGKREGNEWGKGLRDGWERSLGSGLSETRRYTRNLDGLVKYENKGLEKLEN